MNESSDDESGSERKYMIKLGRTVRGIDTVISCCRRTMNDGPVRLVLAEKDAVEEVCGNDSPVC